MDNILVVARQFGVSEIDLTAFAQAIIDDMKRDNMIDAFKLMDEDTRTVVIESYGKAAIKKMQIFTNKYLSTPEAAEAFRATVRNLL